MFERELVDIVLLGLLVLVFGIQQRGRPQLFFRYWFAAWILVFIGYLPWTLKFFLPPQITLWHVFELTCLCGGGMTFFVSFLLRKGWERFTAAMCLTTMALTLAMVSLADSRHASSAVLYLLIVLIEATFLGMIFVLAPQRLRWRRNLLALAGAAFAVAMLLSARAPAPHQLEHWFFAQLFVSTAILYSGTGAPRSLDRFAGTLGFATWGMLYPLVDALHGMPATGHVLTSLWNLPKYAVGFAMTLRIFEGARADIVRLAEGYKVLYEDFRVLYEHHPLPMWIYDAETAQFLSANAAACASYGYTTAEFLQMNVHQILAAPGDPDDREQTQEFGGGETGTQKPLRHQRRDGKVIAVQVTEHEILFQGREARFALAVDVTERQKLDEEMFHRAQHDPLTGLPNRLMLDDRIEQCMARCIRDHRKAVLFTMDADRFKLINDTYGHLVGDEALKAIAERLRSRIRSVDTIARTGGEEFTAIIGGLNQSEDAERIAGMFVRLFDTPLVLPGRELKVSISIGAAVYPDDATDIESLRRKSDQALYHAKRMGRNRFAFTSHEVSASFDQATVVERRLREALRNGGFELRFQPIFDPNGKARRFEALLQMAPRQDTADASTVAPASFLPVAEESGLIVPIGNWMLEEACRCLAAWRRIPESDVCLAVKVSGKQLLQKGFSTLVLHTLAAHGLPPSALDLELTESSLMNEPATIREAMEELASHGVRFVIDHFGTGYSSLARLADLPIAQLKIDRSFLVQLDQTPRGGGIVPAIIHMAQTMLVEVVAEGIENDAQLNTLLRHGCDLFQGDYLAVPNTAAELGTLLQDHSGFLFSNPTFSQTRVAVSKRVRQAQFPALAAPGPVTDSL